MTLLTPWGERLDPERVLAEHPRPQLRRDSWQNLNGIWSCAVTPLVAPAPGRFDEEILVPFCIESALSGLGRRLAPDERLWYRRSFQVPSADARTLLHFGAVDDQCVVLVNGAFAGSHSGGFDAFTIDITEYLRAGDNELTVAVTDPTSADDQPRGKQHLKPQGIWYTPVSGIWQTVWLEQVPRANHIAELKLRPAEEGDGVHVAAFLERPTRDDELALELRVSLNGDPVTSAVMRPDREVFVPVPAARRWRPHDPVLYDLEVRLLRVQNPLPAPAASPALLRSFPLRGAQEQGSYADATLENATLLDRVESYFGLRTIRVGAHPELGHPVLLLNGEPDFQLGTLDQGWWPDGLHTPPADAAMVFEIEFLKAAGFNAVRKHIKIEPDRYYYHCDRLGLLVWQDMPSGFLPAQFVAPNDEAEGLRSSRSSERFERTLMRMVRALGNHPSIVMWVLHNEGWGQFDTRRLTASLQHLDPSRPVNATSGWLDQACGDLLDVHDYDASPQVPVGDGVRASVLGEYGGIGWPLENHLWDPDMRNWGYQTLQDEAAVKAAYEKLTDALVGGISLGLSAAIYTQTTDVEGEVNGLLSYDRRVAKLPARWLRDVNARVTGA